MKKVLELTVLVDYHLNDSAKAYLEVMYKNGFYPKKIIVIGFLQVKFIQKYTKFLGEIYAYKLFKFILLFRNYRFFNHQKKISKIITKYLPQKINFHQKFNLKKYTNNIEYLYIKNYRDEKCISYINSETTKTFLYASSGIVPKEILSLNGVKIIHIHPGIVPDIKGSDGFFWSIALKKRLGYSCFYMNDGIDTGDVILKKEYEIPKIKLPKLESRFLYDSILRYADSTYRADILLTILHNNADNLSNLHATAQNSTDGNTYYIMHSKIICHIIKKYFQ